MPWHTRVDIFQRYWMHTIKFVKPWAISNYFLIFELSYMICFAFGTEWTFFSDLTCQPPTVPEDVTAICQEGLNNTQSCILTCDDNSTVWSSGSDHLVLTCILNNLTWSGINETCVPNVTISCPNDTIISSWVYTPNVSSQLITRTCCYIIFLIYFTFPINDTHDFSGCTQEPCSTGHRRLVLCGVQPSLALGGQRSMATPLNMELIGPYLVQRP